MAHPSDHLDEEEEDAYNSASDEDFNPDNAAPVVENEDSSSSEDDAPSFKPPKPNKRKTLAEDIDFDNSGDEATIKKARRKKRKGSEEDDNDGGDGGLIKTRAQRRAEIQERKPLVNTANSSVDVDALWAQMATSKKPPEPSTAKDETSTSQNTTPRDSGITCPKPNDDSVIPTPNTTTHTTNPEHPTTSTPLPSNTSTTTPHLHLDDGEATITINRTYVFAGETLTEERTVPANSAEARLYLSEQQQKQQSRPSTSTTSTNPTNSSKPPALRRPTKRASMFSPSSTPNAKAAEGPKLTTLQKSKLDWARHVDTEGISEELDEHRKAKGGYLGRMDFLGRMEGKREEEISKAKGGR